MTRALLACLFSCILLVRCRAPPRNRTPSASRARSKRAARDRHHALQQQHHDRGRGRAARLLAAGFPADDIAVLGPIREAGNLVARARLAVRRAAAPVAHLDVVEAKREDWSVDPFALLEKDSLLRARHARRQGDGAIFTQALIRMKSEGTARPRRDPRAHRGRGGGGENGAEWLLKAPAAGRRGARAERGRRRACAAASIW
jgi:hypothetical protein